jgi:hypothetical protein
MTAFVDIETLGSNPYQRRIVMIHLNHAKRIQPWKACETSEPEIIGSFIEAPDFLRNDEVAEFNILNFDFLSVTGRPPAHHHMDCSTHRELHNRYWFDLLQFLGGQNTSVNCWISKCGIKRDCSCTGRDVLLLFERDEYGKVETHGVEDLILCELLHDKLLGEEVRH